MVEGAVEGEDKHVVAEEEEDAAGQQDAAAGEGTQDELLASDFYGCDHTTGFVHDVPESD